ncbi:MAG: hypothetical protein HY077_08245 [Elusimicrobia bacterium]|nr:hypothetical protein [Elusimicrobiota bacterium]
MEIKDLLAGNEKSLPTIEQAMSTSTAAALPTVTAKPETFVKFGLSAVAGLVGAALLISGKKNNDVQKMVIGAALTLASFFLF